jgi:hypothetical protein
MHNSRKKDRNRLGRKRTYGALIHYFLPESIEILINSYLRSHLIFKNYRENFQNQVASSTWVEINLI